MPEIFFYTTYFVFGLVFGSFANVLILRIPAEKSIVPRSQCPKCGMAITWKDNIPVLSWIFLLGKCRNCKTRISFRYPLIELLCGLLFVLAYYRFGIENSLGMTYFGFEFLIFLYFAYVASIIDLEHMILPDVFTLGGCVVGLLGALLNPDRSFLEAFLGFLLGGGFLYLIAFVGYLVYKKEVMGGGDIKLIAWIGAVFGIHAIIPTLMIAGLVPGLVGIVVMIIQRKRITTPIPFGPFLVLGAVATVFLDYPTIVQWLIPLPLNLESAP